MSAEELDVAETASTASSDQPLPKQEEDEEEDEEVEIEEEEEEEVDSLLPDLESESESKSKSNKAKRKSSTDNETDEPLAKRIKSESSQDDNEAPVEAKVEAGNEEDQDNAKAATSSQVRTLVIDGEEYTYNERAAVREERDGIIEFRVVNDDNSRENMIILTGLKNIFQRQLPKMPREYIARLVYDRSHLSIAVVKKPLTVVGGITYRPFESRRFAEIVFCAIASSEQVKGYGAHLMNHLKDYVKATTPIMHFLTYADNYAIGYFRKQGFTKDITLDRSVWMGYIKDYEGGTIMQCTMLPRIRYLDSQKILVRQKAAILTKIREISKSHIVHKGIEQFRIGPLEGIDPMMIPGVREAGWTPEMDELARRPKRGPHYAVMQHLLSELQNHPSAWPFLQPVSKDDVTDYYEVIKEPMDLSTMEQRLDADAYQDIKDFIHDARLVYDNCRSYNNEHTTYFKNANKLEKFMKQRLRDIPEYAELANY